MLVIVTAMPVLQCVFTSMLPLLIKDQLVIASVSLVVIFYLVADLCLSQSSSVSPVNVDRSGNGSHITSRLHSHRTLSLLVSKPALCSST